MRRLSLTPSLPFFPTASELRRAAECVAPWALGLPETEEAPGEWAEMGRRMHEIAENVYLGYRADADDHDESLVSSHIIYALPRDLAAVGVDIDEHPNDLHTVINGLGKRWYVEQGIKWRTDGLDDYAELCTREPGERLRGWFSGTADLVYVRADGVLVVVDWKFGPREHITGEPAEDSCQGFFLALAFCTLLQITGSSDSVVVARFERRMVREDGIEVDGHDITWGELCAWRDTLERLAARIVKAENAAPRISAACGKCKAKAMCFAWLELGARVWQEVGGETAIGLARPPMSPESARALYHAIEAAEGLVSTWREWVRAYLLLHDEGVEIGLGLKLRSRSTASRAVVQTAESLALIEEVAGSAAIETKRKSSIGAIEKAVKEAAGAGITSKSDRDKARKKAVEDAIERLTKAGAILEKGARNGVSVVRSDETETAWMKGEEE